MRLPMVAALAFLAFGEIPDRWTWIGGAMIGMASIYIAHREAQLARQRLAAGRETS
jgi:drug/metabolite transporter (DMT)-like permease